MFKNPNEALDSQRNISISASALAKLFGKKPKEFEALKKLKSSPEEKFPTLSTKVRMKTSFKSHGIIPTKNVLGFLEGTEKKDEYIILSAHYDGRGIVDGKICNGANDNATGVSALLEKEFSASLNIKEKNNYSGSDFVFFERKGIPAIAFTTGSCKDNHGPGDDADKIQYQKLKDISRLIFATVWEITNTEEEIKN